MGVWVCRETASLSTHPSMYLSIHVYIHPYHLSIFLYFYPSIYRSSQRLSHRSDLPLRPPPPTTTSTTITTTSTTHQHHLHHSRSSDSLLSIDTAGVVHRPPSFSLPMTTSSGPIKTSMQHHQSSSNSNSNGSSILIPLSPHQQGIITSFSPMAGKWLTVYHIYRRPSPVSSTHQRTL